MKRIIQILTVVILFSLQLRTSAQDKKIEIPLRFDSYYTYEEVMEALKALNKAYPKLTKLDLVGKSEENREIWALTINNPKTGDEKDKSAIYVDGNIHGNEIQAGEVCLYLASQLLTKYSENEYITQLVDKNVFYILPVVNVDGRAHFWEDANTASSNRGLRRPKDDDRDGLFDEDPPDDLDGDGNICIMRKKDPFGRFKTDATDPRILVQTEKGQKGEWTIIGLEGIDNDGDGRLNEDAEGYVDGNRNWGYNWKPNYIQRGAGHYPFSGVGLQAVRDYLMARPNILVVWAFHNTGGMFLRGPNSKEEGELDRNDIDVYDVLGTNAVKIVPGYRYLVIWKDLYRTFGDFTGFTYNILGAYSIVGELFMSQSQTYSDISKTTKGSTGKRRSFYGITDERLKFNDYLTYGELFVDWKPYNHPVYGEIEIGGWVKMSGRLPHPFMLPDLVHRNASAVLFSASETPEISMEVFETKKIGKNLYRVRVRLANSKAIPSMTTNAANNNVHRKDILTLEGAKVIAGGKLKNKYTNEVDYKEHKPEVQFVVVPGNSNIEYEFLITNAKGKVTINYTSQKTKDLSVTVDL